MKLDRSTFLYMDPSGRRISQFAQCSTCRDWVTGDRLCVIHGPRVKVPGSASCGLYVQGTPQPAGTPTLIRVTPEESGLVNREVRCENCQWFYQGVCKLYEMLNKRLPDVFDLKTEVDSHGCCNAQQED